MANNKEMINRLQLNLLKFTNSKHRYDRPVQVFCVCTNPYWKYTFAKLLTSSKTTIYTRASSALNRRKMGLPNSAKLILLLIILNMSFYGRLAAQNIHTVAGNGFGAPYPGGFSGDGGPATGAELSNPYGVTTDGVGNIYIADYENNRIRMLDTSGVITTVAGNGTGGFSGDGGPATAAELNNPVGIAVDSNGDFYIADQGNQRIREVNKSGVISTLTGNGTGGYTGDGGPATAAEINGPEGVATDNVGNIYIADYWNNRIRKINTAYIITTIAGSATQGYSGDGGPSTASELNGPAGVATDISGNIYIADELNDCIRKINTAGIITTCAGNGILGYSGDGGLATAAELFNPGAVATDRKGNIFIADFSNEIIRKVTPGDTIFAYAGNGAAGFSGDGGAATAAELNAPNGITADRAGNLFIADGGNVRIREVTTGSPMAVETINAGHGEIIVYPNPANDKVYIITPVNIAQTYSVISIRDLTGQPVYMRSGLQSSKLLSLDVSLLANGIYLLNVVTAYQSFTQKVLVLH